MGRIDRIFRVGGILDQSIQGYEERLGQIEMSEAVHQAFSKKQHLIVEAECGIGKTLAYLVPICLQRGLRAVVSTGTRALQEQLYYKDIPVLSKHIRPGLRAVYIKGRGNYVCRHRFEHSRQHSLFDTPEYIKQFQDISEWIEKTRSGDVAELTNVSEYSDVWKEVCCTVETCLGHRCSYYDNCFLMTLKRDAKRSHIIVVNHHLFFADIMMRNGNGRSILPTYHMAIFDEAHMIEDIASYYLSKTVGTRQFQTFIRHARAVAYEFLHQHPHVKDPLLTGFHRLEYVVQEVFSELPERKGRYRVETYAGWDNFRYYLQKLLSTLSDIVVLLEDCQSYSEDFSMLLEELSSFQEQLSYIYDSDSSEYVYWYEIGRVHRTLHASPIDVSSLFRDGIFERIKRVILTSATLTSNGNFSYVRSRIGLDNASERIIHSPFKFEEQGILYLPKDIVTPESKSFPSQMSQRMYEILMKTEGRAFCLFTSYRNMIYTYNMLQKEHVPYTVFKQGDMGRQEIIKRFVNDTHSILLATNTYWQGIDVPGESLSCVVIDKLPFAVPTDPIVYARAKKIEREGGNSFYDFQVPSSVIAIRQGVGRLIRTMSDTGVVSILDKRILTRRYGSLFLDSLPNFRMVHSLDDVYVPSRRSR